MILPRFFECEVEVEEAVEKVVMAVMLLRVLLALWYDTPELFRQRSEDELDMRLFELVLLAEPRISMALLALSLRLLAGVNIFQNNQNKKRFLCYMLQKFID